MSATLAGRHALVCGASEGIGRATALALARLGATITVLARRQHKLDEVLSSLHRSAGQEHASLVADLSDPGQLAQAAQALAATRPVHILINNTAGPPGGAAHTADPASYLAVFQQHLIANQILLQAVLPGMRDAGWGRVVNIISTSVKEPIANLGVSNTIRGAVASWAKTLAGELGGFGITVNNVLPGYTRTQRLEQIISERASATGKTPGEISQAMLATVPSGRFAEAGEIAGVVAFLCSPQADYVNGINLPVDGGRTRSL